MRKLGIYKVSYDQMGKFLNLPEDHCVIDIAEYKDRQSEEILVKVKGPRMPEVFEAHEIPLLPLDYLETIHNSLMTGFGLLKRKSENEDSAS